MRLSIDFRNGVNVGNAAAIAHIHRRISFAFSNVKHEINSASITVADVNGPKGGLDKQCRVVIKANGISDVVVSEKQSSIYHAIDRCLARARQNLARRLKRRRQALTGKQVIGKLPEPQGDDLFA